ncbi:MAG: C1 family peptidase [Pseudomonadota bacterium]
MAQYWEKYKLGGCLMDDVPVKAPELSASAGGLPERVDLRGLCSPVENQGGVGSCAANAAVGAMEYLQRRQKAPEIDLSRLFVYYNARALADTEDDDCGTFIHHAMAAVLAHGACPERMWPYQEAMWMIKPHQACYDAAASFEAIQYARTPLGPVCKATLAAGLPIVFGAYLPSQWMYAGGDAQATLRPPSDGGWPEPGGGHAMLIVGYDDAKACWTVRNSWGAEWGDGGHCYIHYDVMARYSHPHHFWAIGGLEQHATLRLTGVSPREAIAEHRVNAPATVATALSARKAQLNSELGASLATKRESIRNRLRGPGAGGGY